MAREKAPNEAEITNFTRNVLAVVPTSYKGMVASTTRTIITGPDAGHVRAQFDEVTRMLKQSHPKVAVVLDDARHDPLALAGYPLRPWRQSG